MLKNVYIDFPKNTSDEQDSLKAVAMSSRSVLIYVFIIDSLHYYLIYIISIANLIWNLTVTTTLLCKAFSNSQTLGTDIWLD